MLGTASSHGIVSAEAKEPLRLKKIKVVGDIKRKNAYQQTKKNETTAISFMRFVSKVLDEMDKCPETENFYIYIDNAPIHKLEDDTDGVTERAYFYYNARTVALRL
ncbi:hypothetical protein BY458DRAFT_556094 [Sporodiniella umbellata]|nr:hypothetical protein BY458DRAFT_556094 [Sporodiniella umbellata]